MVSYDDWKSMYTPELASIGAGKSKHLQKLDILIHVFNKEVADINKYFQTEYKSVEMCIKKQEPIKPQIDINMNTKPDINTNFVKPSSLRLKKISSTVESTVSSNCTSSLIKKKPIPTIKSISTNYVPNIIKKLPTNSPDMFNQTVEVKALDLDQNIHISDSETIMSSPEKFSPKIKKKRLNKSKQFIAKQNKDVVVVSETKTPKGVKLFGHDNFMESMIESTPEVQSFKRSVRTTTKKKLFEKADKASTKPVKCSQSMYTLTQMYSDIFKNKNKSTNADINRSTKSAKEYKADDRKHEVLAELHDNNSDNSNSSTVVATQSYMDIDELLDKVSNHSMINDDTQICTELKEMKPGYEKKRCRECDLKGSPCRKHIEPVELKEPDETFSGFWDLNFTTETKPKPKQKDDAASQNSTVFDYLGNL